MNNIKPGTYRELFIKALKFYEENTTHTPEEYEAIEFYIARLHDTNYKFGQITTGGKVYAPGELFFGS